MKQHCTVILGSGSKRRKELLASWGVDFDIIVPLEDPIESQTDPSATVLAIAKNKMQSIEKPQGAVCITADTIVHVDGKVFGKPTSKRQAKEMIEALMGRQHTVSTAYVMQGGTEIVNVVHTDVWLQNISPAFLHHYIQTADFMDKAGSYAIQEHAGAMVKQVNGSLTNVIGLPMLEVLRDLETIGAITL